MIKKGELDKARTHAEQAIKYNQDAFSLERLSGQLKAVAQKINPPHVDKTLEGKVRSIPLLQENIDSTDQAKLETLMEQFQEAFKDSKMKNEDLSLDKVYKGSLDQGEIDALMRQIAQVHNLPLGKKIGEAGTNRVGQSTPPSNN